MTDVEKYCKELFEHLRCILFEEQYEDLDVDKFPTEYEQLCQGLNMLSLWMKEYKEFAGGLSTGDLNTKAPDTDNPIVWPIKAFRSNLLHLIWQVQQIAKGNYTLQLNYLQDFSDAFNEIIEQLREQGKLIDGHMEKASSQEKALFQSNQLFAKITEYIDDMIFIYSTEKKCIVFQNEIAGSYISSHSDESKNFLDKIFSFVPSERENTFEVEIPDKFIKSRMLVFNVSSYPIEWQKQTAFVYIVKDLTVSRSKTKYMEKLAFTDSLTGLFNRYYYTVNLKNWLEEKDIFSMCYIDLDGLKSVNDSVGHNEGDVYLRALAELLKKSFRSDDMLFRLGGDEFVVLMNNVDKIRATEKMENIYNAFLKTSTSYPRSMSYGVVEINSKNGHMSMDEILELVDKRMYNNKKAKRANRTK